jgi:hypothetical protein
MTKPTTDADIQKGLLVQLELKEATDRMRAEGFGFDAIMAGIASLAHDIIAAEHNSATASAWFFGMAKNAANIAARDLGLED